MPEIYLASSALALEDFEGKRTIEEASQSGFDGVQLFLDPRYRNPEYESSILENLNQSGLKLVLHLPNTVTDEDIHIAENIVESFPDARVLIHYIPATELPNVNGTKVGWENSQIGPLSDEMVEHLRGVEERVKKDNTFFVFDMGRILYAEGEEEIAKTIDFIRLKIASLDPTKDIIHLADKTSWVLKFRDCMCVLGEGVMVNFIEDIGKFEGAIVFEHENLQMALQSLDFLKSSE